MPAPAKPLQALARLGTPPRLDANLDPIVVSAPWQRGYGQWVLSRMSDVRTVLTQPATTVDLLSPKAIARSLDQQGLAPDATRAILRSVGRAHRVPNDSERLDAIAVTRLLQAALPAQDLRAPLAALAAAGGARVDVMAAVVRPGLMAWRAAALGVEAGLAQGIEDGLVRFMVAVEAAGVAGIGAMEPMAARILHDLAQVRETRRAARDMPMAHWISPAFLAIVPLGYTGGTMLAHLAENPELQERLRAEPDLRPGYLREVERLMNAFRYVVRQIGPAALELGETRLPPRSLVVLDLAAANRDPAIWDDPDLCRPDRPRHPTAAFSFGPLACTGSQLSRQFLAGLLEAVLDTVRLALPSPDTEQDRVATAWSLMRGCLTCRLRVSPVR